MFQRNLVPPSSGQESTEIVSREPRDSMFISNTDINLPKRLPWLITTPKVHVQHLEILNHTPQPLKLNLNTVTFTILLCLGIIEHHAMKVYGTMEV
jgi:hypothetical protein